MNGRHGCSWSNDAVKYLFIMANQYFVILSKQVKYTLAIAYGLQDA